MSNIVKTQPASLELCQISVNIYGFLVQKAKQETRSAENEARIEWKKTDSAPLTL